MGEPSSKVTIRLRDGGEISITHTLMSEDGVRYSETIDRASAKDLAKILEKGQEAHARVRALHYKLAQSSLGQAPSSQVGE